MPTVTCPSCGEKGRIPETLIGAKIKCRKCETSFLVTPAASKSVVAAPAPVVAAGASGAVSAVKARSADHIEVDGLDDAAWSAPAVAAEDHEHDHPEHHADDAQPAFTPHSEGSTFKQYKLLTPKDKCFEGKFDHERLEQQLNLLGKQGWVVKGMATPHVAGFSGGDKEQLIILLER